MIIPFSYFCESSSHLHFCNIFLVQLCIIIVRNSMFYIKIKSSNLVTNFYYVYLLMTKKWKTFDLFWWSFIWKVYFFLSHVVFNLTMEWNPLCLIINTCMSMMNEAWPMETHMWCIWPIEYLTNTLTCMWCIWLQNFT